MYGLVALRMSYFGTFTYVTAIMCGLVTLIVFTLGCVGWQLLQCYFGTCLFAVIMCGLVPLTMLLWDLFVYGDMWVSSS
jgi:hypothetical protein